MPNSNTRPPVSFNQILGEADRIYPYYVQREADFAAKKALRFTPQFKITLAANIAAAHAKPSDTALRSAQASETALLKEVVTKFRPLSNDLQTYLDDLTNGRDPIKAEFGNGRINEIISSPDSLIRFLDDLPSLFANHAAALAGLGIPDSLKTAFTALRDELVAHVTSRNNAMDSRHGATPERTELMNSILADLTSIEDTANVIYANNPAAKILFTVDRSSHTRHNPNPPPAAEPPKSPPV